MDSKAITIKETGPSQDAAATIEADLHCLFCAYNLRGLSGDPVRCPECGNLNDCGVTSVPAHLTRLQLRKMEISPTVCAGFASSIILISLPLAYARMFLVAQIATTLAVLGWVVFYFRMKGIYQDRRGGRAVLRDIHAATFLCSVALPILWGWLYTVDRPHASVWTGFLLTALFLTPAFFVLGLSLYRRAQLNIEDLQRETAVRLAREMLRGQAARQRQQHRAARPGKGEFL